MSKPLKTISQGGEGAEGSSYDLILEVARAHFEQVESHIRDLETKARTYLTVNALMMATGILAIVRGGIPESVPPATVAVVVALLVMLIAAVGLSYWYLLRVLSVRTIKGVPKAGFVIREYEARPRHELEATLARYLAQKAESNQTDAVGIATSLECATLCSRVAFVIFVATIIILLVSSTVARFQ